MIRYIALIPLTGFVFVFNSCHEIKSRPTIQKKPGNSLLWEISSDSIPYKSYLYGTIHIQDSRVFLFDSVVENAFKRADILAVEVELDLIDYGIMMNAIMMKDSTLEQLLSPEDYGLLESKYYEYTGASLRTAARVKPFFLGANIIQSLVKKDKSIPLDLHFIKEARAMDKPVVGLETFDEQIAMIDELSYTEQARMLIKSLTDTVDMPSLFNTMLNAYLAMDGDKLIVLTTDPSLPEEFMKKILVDRNHLMTERLLLLIKERAVFCAVGAAHLFGNEGIIELLRSKGFTVRGIDFNFLPVRK